MDDVNRPLRRLEIAQRIKDLREKATVLQTEAGEATARAAAAQPVAGPALATFPPSPPEAADETDDDSAASTIASLLRGGQTWMLDQGDRP